jgi:hypothetical protein
MIVTNQWQPLFAELTRKHKGRPVGLDRDRDLLLNDPASEQVTLESIEYDRHHGVVVTVGRGTEQETIKMENASMVWAVRDDDEDLVAIQVVAGDGRKLNLRAAPDPGD